VRLTALATGSRERVVSRSTARWSNPNEADIVERGYLPATAFSLTAAGRSTNLPRDSERGDSHRRDRFAPTPRNLSALAKIWNGTAASDSASAVGLEGLVIPAEAMVSATTSDSRRFVTASLTVQQRDRKPASRRTRFRPLRVNGQRALNKWGACPAPPVGVCRHGLLHDPRSPALWLLVWGESIQEPPRARRKCRRFEKPARQRVLIRGESTVFPLVSWRKRTRCNGSGQRNVAVSVSRRRVLTCGPAARGVSPAACKRGSCLANYRRPATDAFLPAHTSHAGGVVLWLRHQQRVR